jgi:hypothetical protein
MLFDGDKEQCCEGLFPDIFVTREGASALRKFEAYHKRSTPQTIHI